MIVISRHVAIPDGELEITAIRAQGAVPFSTQFQPQLV